LTQLVCGFRAVLCETMLNKSPANWFKIRGIGVELATVYVLTDLPWGSASSSGPFGLELTQGIRYIRLQALEARAREQFGYRLGI
jgi:hypothetical protein